ncbi:hypothetical protein ABEG18_02265 [Alsobacter sp. KACC 23698]|uniref:Uncharacterized protein n=1 Tax=Alsobacter sp. KACC 23698 TaxID=3149229 RepID=A0AAU7JHT3_9HYPH
MLKTIAMAAVGALLSLSGAAAASDTLPGGAILQGQSGRIELAQYYEPPPPPGYYRPRPPSYDPDPYYRPRQPEYRPDPYRQPRPYYQEQPVRPRGRMTDMCITSRGACRVYPQPTGRPCRCDVPGFGTKRGVTGY